MYETVWQQLLGRPAASHKYDFGHVLVIGGSPGMVGAPFLAALAALRVGAGLVTIAAPKAVTAKLERRVVEVMTLALPAGKAPLRAALRQFIKERKVSVLVVGPGLQPALARQTLEALNGVGLPVIIDGGGLSAAAAEPALLKQLGGPLILTPHPGEFERFFDKPLPQTAAALRRLAVEFARHHQLTLVLKTAPVLVVGPGGKVHTNTSGGPALATAGTGDVLSGVIAGLVAQGIDAGTAAGAAAYLHGLAGDLAGREKTVAGVIASDVVAAIPAALRSLAGPPV